MTANASGFPIPTAWSASFTILPPRPSCGPEMTRTISPICASRDIGLPFGNMPVNERVHPRIHGRVLGLRRSFLPCFNHPVKRLSGFPVHDDRLAGLDGPFYLDELFDLAGG